MTIRTYPTLTNEGCNDASKINTNFGDIDTYVEALEAAATTPFVRHDGTVALSANWDAGSFRITAETLESDVAAGTAPLVVASNTVVTNLNADLWDGNEFADYLDQAMRMADTPTFAGLTLTGDIAMGGNNITGVGTVDGVDVSAHAARHENGGADEISVAGLSGELADAQPVAVSKNSGAIVGTRSELNFIEGANITLTIADDAGNDEVDITIAAAGGGGAHDILSATHSDTLAAAVSRGSLIYGNATPAWAELVHPAAAYYHLETDATDVAWQPNITIPDSATIGSATTPGAMQIVASGNVYFSDSIVVADNIYHNGDLNTYISLVGDRVLIYAGGYQLCDFRENLGSSYVQFNADNRSVRFSWHGDTNDDLLYGDPTLEEIHIGHSNDSIPLIFGAAQDAGTWFDGSNWIFDSQLVAANHYDFRHGTLYKDKGDSGGVPDADADEVVIESSGSGGFSVLVAAGQTARQYMGDATDPDYFEWLYSRTDTLTTFSHGGAEVLRIDTDNTRIVLETHPAYLTDVLTNDTNKEAQLRGYNYDVTNEGEGWTMLYGTSTNIVGTDYNVLNVGGGDTAANAVTAINFYIAANGETRTGTNTLSIDADTITAQNSAHFRTAQAVVTDTSGTDRQVQGPANLNTWLQFQDSSGTVWYVPCTSSVPS